MTTLAEREQAVADAELEACCNFLLSQFDSVTWHIGNTCGNQLAMSCRLRAARRPEAPSLAEKGLAALVACTVAIEAEYFSIRDALLRLQELERAASTTTTTETTND